MTTTTSIRVTGLDGGRVDLTAEQLDELASAIGPNAGADTAWRVSRHPVEADGLPHQALVGVQDVQDLREGLRVGGDSRPRDHHDRMRAVR